MCYSAFKMWPKYASILCSHPLTVHLRPAKQGATLISFPSVPQQDPSLQLSAPPRQGHATRSWLGTVDAHGWPGARGRVPAARVNAHTRSKAGATTAECGTGTVPAPLVGNLEQQRGCSALNWSWRALQHSPRAGVGAHVQGQQLRASPAAITRRGL